MSTRTHRFLFLSLAAATVSRAAFAATPLCSVYVESFSALQKQLLLGAQAYQSPQLGALPLMMTAGLPGAQQMDQEKPVAFHMLDLGDGETGMVIEISPSGAPNAFLQALAGEGVALPEPADGVYTLGKGVSVKIVGNRLRLALKADHAAASLSVGTLPEMPALPGVLRVSLSPAALAPKLDGFKKNMAAQPPGGGAQAEQGMRAMSGMMDFYSQLLRQVDALHLGLNMQQEGVFIRTRLAPKPGSDVAGILSSGKPVSAAQLGFFEKDSLFSYATGGCAMPERFQEQLVSFYTQMAAASPLYKEGKTNEFAAVMRQSIRMLGAPMAFTGRLSEDGAVLLMQGAMGVADPAAFLKEQVEMMRTPAFMGMMGQSGIKFPAPTTRDCKGLTVYSWKTQYDEAALKEAARAALPADLPAEQADAALESSLASMRLVMKLFGQGYEYAATPKAVVYGMGAPEMIEGAVDRIRNPARESAEAARIEAVLSPSGTPCSLGRISLNKLLGIVVAAQPGLAAIMKAAQVAPSDEGLVFAAWPYKEERLTALLIPASEIKAISAFAQASAAQAMQRAQGGAAAPARPPIPPNF